MNVGLPGALGKLVISCCFNSWFGLAGLTPTETRSLCLASNKYTASSITAENPSSHVEEQGKRAVQC